MKEMTEINKEESPLQAAMDAEKVRACLVAIVESSEDAIIGKKLNGIVFSWNKGAENIFGYSSEEMIGKHISLLVPPGHFDDIAHLLERIKLGERTPAFETVRMRKDGLKIDVALTLSPIRISTGEIIGVSTIARNITERKIMEAALREKEQSFIRIFQSSPEGMALTTLNEGVFLDANEEFLRSIGRSREEVIGHTAQELGLWEDLSVRTTLLSDLMTLGKVHNRELTKRNKSGELSTVLWSGEIITIGGKEILLSTAMDITERKRLERDREVLIAQLHDALDQVKQLSGVLPICMHCKKIRNDNGCWSQLEVYISEHSDARFSHGLCSDCAKKHYPDYT